MSIGMRRINLKYKKSLLYLEILIDRHVARIYASETFTSASLSPVKESGIVASLEHKYLYISNIYIDGL